MFGFPLLLIPLAVCNIIVFLMPGVSFAAPLFSLPLLSGAAWAVTLSDALVTFGLLLLLLEVQKSARPGGKYLTDHLLALLIFAGAAVEFLLLPQFANATFFVLTLVALVDFLSGLALRGRRPKRVRDVQEIVATPPASQPMPQPVVVREPLREPAFQNVTTPEPAPPHHVETAAIEPLRHEPETIEPLPPRVEPIIDVDPMLEPTPDDPRPVRPASHV